MKRIFLLLSILLLVLLAPSAWGATVYIDPTCTYNGDGTGQDCAAGAGQVGAKNTWSGLTWTAGNSYLQKVGTTYSSQITVGASGSAGNTIVLGSYGTGVKPIVTTNAASSAIYATGRSYITIQDLDVRNTRGTASDSVIRLTGTAGSNISILRNTISNSAASGYGINIDQPLTTLLVDSNAAATAIVNQWIYVYGNPSTDVTVTNNSGSGCGAIAIRYAVNPTVSGNSNLLVASGQNGITVQDGSGVLTVQNNTVTGTPSTYYSYNIYTGTYTSGAVTGNTALSGNGSGFRYYNIAGPASFITSQNNTSSSMGGAGFVINGTSSNIKLSNETASNGSSDGFIVDNTANNITFNSCLSNGNGNKSSTSSGDGFTVDGTNYNIAFNYCVSKNNTVAGFTVGAAASSGTIYNCVAYGNGGNWTSEGGLDQVRGGFFMDATGVNPTTGLGWTVKNSVGMGNYPVEVNCDAVSKGIVTFDYNVYSELDAAKFATLDRLATTIAWSTYSSREAHSQNANPRFRSSSDFRLLPSSPAINKGTPVGLTTDFLGHSLRGTPDIGAYEYYGQNGGGFGMNFGFGW